MPKRELTAEVMEEKLRRAGYRLTTPRRVVIRVVESTPGHITPPQILQRGRELYPALSRATVYRSLWLLAGLGLLWPVYSRDGALSFIRTDESHHHLVCSRCGAVIEVGRCEECPAEETVREVADRLGFEISAHLLEFYGLCRECREALASEGGDAR